MMDNILIWYNYIIILFFFLILIRTNVENLAVLKLMQLMDINRTFAYIFMFHGHLENDGFMLSRVFVFPSAYYYLVVDRCSILGFHLSKPIISEKKRLKCVSEPCKTKALKMGVSTEKSVEFNINSWFSISNIRYRSYTRRR